jgi:hypothetical protein
MSWWQEEENGAHGRGPPFIDQPKVFRATEVSVTSATATALLPTEA